jgi:hypothetical protein
MEKPMRYNWLLTLLAFPLSLQAQMLDVQAGARIRVTAPGVVAGRVEGTVINRSGDSIVIATPALAQYRLGMSSLATLEVFQGRSHGLGAEKGALWGAGVMLPFALLATMDTPRSSDALAVATEVEIVYAGIGAIIGSIIGADSWSAHSMAPTISSSGGAIRVGTALRF